jgi:hypothetical protein
MGIEPTSEAWELSETSTYAPVSVRTNMSIRKERYWLRNRELVHGAKMYVMPQLGVRISWRDRCKPGPRHQFCFSSPSSPGLLLPRNYMGLRCIQEVQGRFMGGL